MIAMSVSFTQCVAIGQGRVDVVWGELLRLFTELHALKGLSRARE